MGSTRSFDTLAAQASGSGPLGISGYYSGRVCNPTMVATGRGNLIMVFASYSTAKPLPSMGTSAAQQLTVALNESVEYRGILTVTLHPVWR